jgi:hypothetical protein
MINRHLYILTAVLALLGISLFLYKLLVLQFPLQPESESQVWEYEARFGFSAEGKPVKVKAYIPSSGKPLQLIDEQFFSGAYGLSTRKQKEGEAR